MKIKTMNLVGVALDWAVAKCEGMVEQGAYETPCVVDGELHLYYCDTLLQTTYDPSTDWGRGGPIIEREKISTTIDSSGLWLAFNEYNYCDEKMFMQCDRSKLVAAMRCYVASKFGDEVDVPEGLV